MHEPSTVLVDSVKGSLDVLRFKADVAQSQTDSALVAAVVGKKIRLLSLVMIAGGTATNVTFNTKPAGAGTAISCVCANGANGGAVLPRNRDGWLETNSGEGLSVTTGAGSSVGFMGTYALV